MKSTFKLGKNIVVSLPRIQNYFLDKSDNLRSLVSGSSRLMDFLICTYSTEINISTGFIVEKQFISLVIAVKGVIYFFKIVTEH